MQPGTKLPQGLDGFFRAGDDDSVKAEQKSREDGYQRPEEYLFFHKMFSVIVSISTPIVAHRR